MSSQLLSAEIARTASPRDDRAKCLEDAVGAWRTALGADSILESARELERYMFDTGPSFRGPRVAVVPSDAASVREFVGVASRFRVPFHPISTGRNWGYGTTRSCDEVDVLLDLRRLDRIIDFDPELGLVTLEPGVTQAMLSHFLEQRSAPFMTPVTGAGPSASLIGNALERGYGLTPICDHFSALIALEAVLPDGTIYRSPLATSGSRAGVPFRWGVGPYLDGLFSQSGFGIVTSATIALARRPERTLFFVVWIRSEDDLKNVVNVLREFLNEPGSCLSGLNLMSPERVGAMTMPPSGDGRAVDVSKGSWIGIGAIYGKAAVVGATMTAFRKALRPFSKGIATIDRRRLSRLRALTKWIPGRVGRNARTKMEALAAGLTLLEGYPDETPLSLPYVLSGKTPPSSNRNPATDRCGLTWYAPLVPMRGADTQACLAIMRGVCAKYGFPAPVTFTSLSSRVFDATLPIVFDPEDESAVARASSCFKELVEEGRARGYEPYRMKADSMALVLPPAADRAPAARLAARLSSAIDPHALCAPGRYVNRSFV